MIRVIALLSVALWCPISVFAMNPALMQAMTGSSAAAAYDCSGDMMFGWPMEDNDSTSDVTVGTPTGCSDGDTISTQTGSPVFSGVQKTDGSLSLLTNANAEEHRFSVSAKDIIDPDNIKMTFDLWVVSYPAAPSCEIFRTKDDASNLLYFLIDDSGNLNITHNGQGIVDAISVALSTGSWLACEYQARTGVAGNDHYIACGGSSTEEDDDLGTMLQSMDTMYVGDKFGSNACEVYRDKLKIYHSDKYSP